MCIQCIGSCHFGFEVVVGGIEDDGDLGKTDSISGWVDLVGHVVPLLVLLWGLGGVWLVAGGSNIGVGLRKVLKLRQSEQSLIVHVLPKDCSSFCHVGGLSLGGQKLGLELFLPCDCLGVPFFHLFYFNIGQGVDLCDELSWKGAFRGLLHS